MGLECKYCGGHMSLAWPKSKNIGAIMSCDACRATCQFDLKHPGQRDGKRDYSGETIRGMKAWDWKEGIKDE